MIALGVNLVKHGLYCIVLYCAAFVIFAIFIQLFPEAWKLFQESLRDKNIEKNWFIVLQDTESYHSDQVCQCCSFYFAIWSQMAMGKKVFASE